MKLKKFLTLTRAGIIESLQFRLGTLVIVAGNLLYLIIVYFLWKAIYASAGTDVVNGMTFSDTLIYLVLALHCSSLWKCTSYGKWAGVFNPVKSYWIC